MRVLFAIFSALILSQQSFAGDAEPKLVASSHQTKVELLELFSSESCSSCPPADRWVSDLQQSEGLWKKFVPVVFHVDYWNHLGWRDKYSSPAMTKRQRDISATWTNPSVYTPVFTRDGKEWRDWRKSSGPNTRLDSVKTKIQLEVWQKNTESFQVKATGLEKNRPYVVHLVRLGMGISGKVSAGENSGSTLKHNFIALDWAERSLPRGQLAVEFALPRGPNNAPRYAIAAWIEADNIPISLQAAGGFL